MAETVAEVEIDNNLLDNNKIIIKSNKQINFTCLQIKNLLQLQLLDMSPQNCILSVSSALEIDNIEENFRHFWLADIMAVVVKNIQRACMNDVQSTTVVNWIIHFISLAVDEALSKSKLFKTLYEYNKIGLANADVFMIPAISECSNSNHNMRTSRSSVKSKFDFNSTVAQTAQQMIAFITNTIHEIFWDDFKYTVIQMAFDTEQPEHPERPEVAKANDIQKINDFSGFFTTAGNEEEIKDTNYNFKCCAIIDRYFFRGINCNKPLTSI